MGANALFGNKNNKNGEERRRRLSQRNMADVDVDAATGTVKHVMTAEQKAAEEAAKSCDGQMAQSLVKANEGMLMAKTERDEALQDKKEALARVEVLETTVEGLNAKIEEMDSIHAEVVAAFRKQVEDAKADLEAQLAAKDAASAAALKDLETSKDQVIADLEVAIAAGREPVEAEFRSQIEELKASSADKVSQLEADLAAKVAEYEAKLEAQAAEHEESLKTTKEEAKKYMITQVNAVKDEMASLQKQHEEKEAETHGHIQKLGAIKKQVEEEKSQFAKMSAELKEEVEMWRENFRLRKYVNLTDIYVDFVDGANAAAEKTSETAEYVWDKIGEGATIAKTELGIFYKDGQLKLKEGKQKFDKFYDEQHAIYWPQIEPHYKEHVVPLIKQKDALVKEFVQWRKKEIDPTVNDMTKEYNKHHAAAAKAYGEQCKASLKSAGEMDLPYFDEVNQYAQQSCNNPDTSVTYIRNGLIILVLLPFRHWILAPVYWVWGCIWWLLLTITPLGFFFSKNKKAPPAAKQGKAKAVNTNGVRVKKKGKNVAQ